MLNHMVEQHAHLDAVFHALADPTRRAMLGQLAERELTIGELATPFSMSFAGASKHVRVLENAGLVTRTIRGRSHLCRLQAERLAEAERFAINEYLPTLAGRPPEGEAGKAFYSKVAEISGLPLDVVTVVTDCGHVRLGDARTQFALVAALEQLREADHRVYALVPWTA